MVEVFKTNVQNPEQASRLKNCIEDVFADYEVNFDLQDCDKVLRVKCTTAVIEIKTLLQLLEQSGVSAELLEDC